MLRDRRPVPRILFVPPHRAVIRLSPGALLRAGLLGVAAMGAAQARAQTSAAALPGPATANTAIEAMPSVNGAPPVSPQPEGAYGLRKRYDPDRLDFAADEVDYQDDTDVVTALGNVFVRKGEQTVRAEKLVWNRKTGRIVAEGNLRVVDAEGNELLTQQMELNEDLTFGLTHNLLMLMREGGRLAANEGQHMADGRYILSKAAYTGCDVVDAKGCPKNPAWRITARHVVYDPNTRLVRFKGARLELFGLSIVPIPSLKVATDGRALPGFLVPDFRISSSNGAEASTTYYTRIADNRDLALTGYVFTKARPMAKVHYRALTDNGAYQITGYLTQSTATTVSGETSTQQWRGYVDTNGHFQLSTNWSIDFSGRFVSDRTFLRRYYINYDDTLRSTVNVERIDKSSYLSISGWAFQTLRTNEQQGLVPIALPMIDYRRRLENVGFGGTLELEANTLAISRSAGQDTQRAFTSAQWSLRRITGMGQVVTLTGLVRGDVYHSSSNALTSTLVYQGQPGWQSRAIALAAVDVTWPLVGEALGGTQVFTPHVQLVASPHLRNMAIPNEDGRSIELQESNLFALNRFPGYDRVEDGNRVVYGADWQLERSRWRVNATVGQSYRLSSQRDLLPDGTGLSDRMSDIVGRIDLRYRDFFKITHRFRIDHNTFEMRRNEIDASIGSDATYFEAGYARINRQLNTTLEDLPDSDELRAAGRITFARYWSVFGSGIFDLSNTTLLSYNKVSAFQPLRTRLGISFQSDCFQFDLTWRRDYLTIGDAARGSSFELRFALKNLGFR